MSGQVVANESDIRTLKGALETAGAEYKTNYARLESLVQEITNGDITGDAANTLLNKFNEKKDMLDTVQKAVDDAEAFVQEQEQKFNNLMNGLMDGMR